MVFTGRHNRNGELLIHGDLAVAYDPTGHSILLESRWMMWTQSKKAFPSRDSFLHYWKTSESTAEKITVIMGAAQLGFVRVDSVYTKLLGEDRDPEG